MMTVQVLVTAGCYLLFNTQFFLCSAAVLGQKPVERRHLLWTFLLNYGAFFLCSVLELHLIVNWTVFLLLLFRELAALLRRPVRECLLMALLGAQVGLAINIFLRSLVAIMMDIPLVAFDNNSSMPGNMKVYPVLLGFLLAGGLFWAVGRLMLLKRLSFVLTDLGTTVFLVGLLAAMYLYLCLNLLVYYIPENSLVLKLWSMKSSVFVVGGDILSVSLAIRMGKLSTYRSENRRARRLLAEERLREEELRLIAQTDPLTGCGNRQRAERQLAEGLPGDGGFSLCFVDLNGLKTVNDSFGHEEGDNYLLAVAEALKGVCGPEDGLFRYGGDEFLLLFPNLHTKEAEMRLQSVQGVLGEAEAPFPMSVSYGIVEGGPGDEAAALIRAADEEMYRMKGRRG